jgi:predicted acyltransferase (DUF342 family)
MLMSDYGSMIRNINILIEYDVISIQRQQLATHVNYVLGSIQRQQLATHVNYVLGSIQRQQEIKIVLLFKLSDITSYSIKMLIFRIILP